MKFWRLQQVVLVLCMCSGSVWAKSPSTLSLNEAIDICLKRDFNTAIATSAIEESGGEQSLAKSLSYPQLSLDVPTPNARLVLNQTLYSGGLIQGQKDVARLTHEGTQIGLKLAHRNARLQTIANYLMVVKQREQLEAEHEAGRILDELKEYIKRARKHSWVSKIDELSIETASNGSSAELIGYEVALDVALAKLRDSTGINDLEAASLSENLSIPKDAENRTQPSLNVAQLALQDDELKILEDGPRLIDAQRLAFIATENPTLSAIGVYGVQMHAFTETSPVSLTEDGARVGLLLRIPLFSGFSRSARNKIYQEKRAHAEIAYRKRKSEIEQAINEQIKRRAGAVKYSRSLDIAIEGNKSLLDNLKKNFKVGLVETQAWISSALHLKDLKIAQYEAAYNYLVSDAYLRELQTEP